MTYYEYDKIGRNTAIVDALGNRTTFLYNAKSQLESMTDPMGRTYTYSYDDNGNRIKTTYPNGTSVSSVYDSRGRVTRQTDQHGYNTYYVYDGADRLIRVTNAQGVSTSYAYDEVGNMTSVTDGNGNVTAYAYDDFGRVVKTTNALGNSAYTTYDKSGNVLTSTDYAGSLTSYTYDSLDRVSSKTTPDGTVSFAYTTDGKISTVTDSSGVTSFAYDNMDGLTRVDYPDGNYVSYGYDNACRLTAVTTPFGTTAYEYDLLDRLTRVVDRNGYATVYEYDANGNRTAVHYANGFTTTYEYDLLNRLICEKTVDNRDNVVVQYVYALGAAGERKSVTELDRTVEYSYDSLYRLTSETITEDEKVTVYTYAYDNVSNRILKNENGAATEYVYNALNQLVSDSNTSYEYDLNGNLVRVIGSAQSALYEYNAENKLIKATVQNGVLVIEESYAYDYQGNRTSKTTHRSDGVTEYVKYINDNSSLTNVLAEIGSEGSVQAYYTIGADLISQERDGKVSVYLYDGHGSVVGLANESGVVTDTYCYDAFGNLLKSKGSTKNCYRYCGEQFDETTGLYYLRARYMDTSTGRFISQDSYAGSISDPISLHKYLYANANPVMNSDPSGYMNKAELIAAEIILGIVAVSYAMASQSAMGIGMPIIKELRALNAVDMYEDTLIDFQLEFGAVGYGYSDYIFGDLLTKPFKNIWITPLPEPEPWIETFPIPEPEPWIESMPIPESEPWIESFTIPDSEPWIETFPIPSEGTSVIVYYDYKKPVSGKTGKEAANDVPSWAKGNRPYTNESGKDFAKRLMDEKYGPGNYKTGPGSEYNKIKKWGDRGFE